MIESTLESSLKRQKKKCSKLIFRFPFQEMQLSKYTSLFLFTILQEFHKEITNYLDDYTNKRETRRMLQR